MRKPKPDKTDNMSREELIKYAARLKSMIGKIQSANAQLSGERDVLRNEARAAYEAETVRRFEIGKRILELEAEVNLWRNRHSELFMQLNPITEPDSLINQ